MQHWLSGIVKRVITDDGNRLILRHLWWERGLFALTLLVTGLGALFEGVGLGLLIPFLESLLNPGAEPFSTGWTWVDQNILLVEASKLERLYGISGMILGTILLRGLLGYLGGLTGVALKENILASLRQRLIEQVQAVSLRFFATKSTGEIINVLTNEIQRIARLFGTSTAILTQGSMALVYATALFALSWHLALAALAICGLLFGIMTLFLSTLREQGREVPDANSRLTSIASEMVQGIRTVTLAGTKKFETSRFREATENVRNILVRMGRLNALAAPLSNMVASTALIGIVIVAVQFFVLPGYLSAAALLTFLFALFRLLPLVKSLNGLRGNWAVQRGSLETVASFLSEDEKPYLEDGDTPLESFRNSIEVQDVDFAYVSGQPVLRDISLIIERGETVAFVGSSGAGKSTLADIIMRLYDPTHGRILIDGRDIREYTLKSLRNHISAVSQDTFLFNDTVLNNLTYGRENLSMDEVRQAAKQANALEFIESLEHGFDTQLGERGARLSGGQRQRIAIARALLSDPDILVLDEATSALDSVTEKLVQESLEYLMEGRTVIVIAHRLSTIENADKVVVLEDSRVVEQGPYDELIARRGQLWEYHSIQYQAA